MPATVRQCQQFRQQFYAIQNLWSSDYRKIDLFYVVIRDYDAGVIRRISYRDRYNNMAPAHGWAYLFQGSHLLYSSLSRARADLARLRKMVADQPGLSSS